MGSIGFLELLLLFFFTAIYFLPSIIGYKKRNSNSIFVLNLFLGWTFIGWVAALVWAVSNEDTQKNKKNTTEQLVQLKQLYEDGTLTKEEFEEEKRKILE